MMRMTYFMALTLLVLTPRAFCQDGSETGQANAHPQKPWVVLSNLSFKREGIAGVFEVDFELVEGEPEDGAEYVWVVEVGVGTRLKKYAEFPITFEPERGHLRNAARGLGSVAGDAETYIAKKSAKPEDPPARGPAQEKISGVLKQGEAKSAAKRPPTIAELAGPDAVGKLFAIANPAIEPGRDNQPSFSVEFQLQGEPDAEARYFWVVKPATGNPIQFDVTLSVRRTKEGTGKFIAAPRGIAIDENQRPYVMSIETPKGDSALRGHRETISNTVTLK